MHEAGVERIDGLYFQARRAIQKLPVKCRIAFSDFPGEVPKASVVIAFRRIIIRGTVQGSNNTVVHFTCRLARKRNSKYLFGSLNTGKKTQDALYQQAGFSRTGWRLHDIGTVRTQCKFPRLLVGNNRDHLVDYRYVARLTQLLFP